METQLLDRYLKNVAKGLPEAQRDDIVSELREDIQSDMEEREKEIGRPLTEDDQMAILRQRGNPWLLAARYRQDERSVAFGKQLIGPVLFPFYTKVLSFNLGLTAVVIGTIFAALALSGNGVSVGDIFSTCLWQLIIQLSIVTLIFSLVERHLAQHPDRWNLSGTGGALRFDMKVDHRVQMDFGGKRRIPRLESVSIIIASTIALVWLTGLRTYPFLILGPAAAFLKLAPVWYQAYFPIVLLTVAEIVRAVINLVEPDWVLFRQVYGLFVHAGGLLVVFYLIRAGVWVMAEPGGAFARAAEVVNRVMYYGLIVTAASSAVMLAIRFVRVVRGTKSPNGVGEAGKAVVPGAH